MRLPFLNKLPVDPRDILKASEELAAERSKPVRLAVIVELDAPDALLDAIERELAPHTAAAEVDVVVAGQAQGPLPSSTDAVIGLVGSGSPQLVDALAEPRRRAIPTVALHVTGQLNVTPAQIHSPIDDFLSGEDADTLVREQLGAWLVEHLAWKRLALAANFNFARSAVVWDHVKSTALQNAVIGGVTIIPGTDMPIMTANQSKMLLQIAAAYGQPLGAERIAELGAVLGSGFALRALARQLLDFVPGFGWIIKGGIGYTGTIAMGKAAQAYFERGSELEVGALTRAAVESAGEMAEKAKEHVRHRFRHTPPADETPKELEAAGAGEGT